MIEQKKRCHEARGERSDLEEDLVIPGGMPVGIYMKTKGVMVLMIHRKSKGRRCRIRTGAFIL